MIYNNLNWEIPSSVDLESFLIKHPPAFKFKIDHFYYIIEYLSKGMELEDLDNNEGFINMSSAKLQKAVHNYKEYLNHLLKHGFILTDKKYIVDEKCTGYLINKYSFHKAYIKLIPIQTSVIKKNRAKNNIAFNTKLKATVKKYSFLTKWFNPKLQIDVEKALNKVEELFPEQTGPIRGKTKGKPSIWTQRFKAIYSINKFSKQEFYFSVDENVGRFHSNLTNIKRELRNYITYDGHKLVNIDIKNSQPLFSTLLFNKDFYNEKSQHINISNIPSSIPFLSNTNTSFSSFTIMLVKTLENTDYQDFQDYIDMVNSGEFYKLMSEQIYKKNVFDKKAMKEMIFIVFFSRNRFIGQVKAKPKRDFRDTFPEVYNFFNLIKKIDHRALAHILQRIESEIIIQNVSKRISIEKPELPIFTIHDSVATTLGNEEYVSAIIKEEVLKLTGLNAKLGIEHWV